MGKNGRKFCIFTSKLYQYYGYSILSYQGFELLTEFAFPKGKADG
jgi:hypothetical protein